MSFSHQIVIVDTCKHYVTGIAGVLTNNKLANTVIPAVVEPRDLALDNSLLQCEWVIPPPPPIIYIIGPNMTEAQAFELCRLLAGQQPKPKIMMISAAVTDVFFEADVYLAGACACLPRYVDDDTLCKAIVNVAAGYTLISAEALALARMPIKLSNAEHRVLTHMAQGLSNVEIGACMNNEPSTIKVHVKHILSKLQVNSREAAVSRARRLGLLAMSTP